MPNCLGNVLVAMSLIAASVGPKLWIQRHSAQVDTNRLNNDVNRRLTAANFETAIDNYVPATAVRARRADCRLIVRNGDRARELSEIFKREAAEYGPVVIGYRGDWTSRPARARSILERFAQDGAARIGFDFGRPAVLALAQSGRCVGVREALRGTIAYSYLKSWPDGPDI